ncbi:heme ABC transporter ATP-binding protein [Streptosporangium sp. NBC_01755]|uniref:heme ABC transporter ATP-binding protein n=1 Tax=unclassified Streptosporangium TaxID=2632669 RepID=UPI002DDB63A5|nr:MULTISPECIES: heme ABC transporter ATP-binding protein [unclassified Streptosporangium]WSA24276.1 heme ABC transporter ATP-binding protein [Streptosporangium sp. NBC_01810]WSC97650.1 heme ABC transporter ATP-binding protein [Streptosporangium sp. NBC_01755]
MIDVSGVSLTAGSARLLDDVSLRVAPGELVAIAGPNGAGKSSLLSVLAGDVPATHGAVTLAGRPVRALRPAALARLRAVLPQRVTLAFPFTVAEVVAMGLYGSRRPAHEEEEILARAMEVTDVAHLAGRTYPTLSGGEQARVSLARVLVQSAPILLLDEPTAALDLRHQEQVMCVARERAAAGDAVVVVLHDLNLAAAYAGRVLVMSGGRLVADGSPDRVLASETLSEVYGCAIDVHRNGSALLVAPRRAV